MGLFRRFIYSLTWLFCWPLFKFFTRFRVKHQQNGFSVLKPVIIVSNHLSLIDGFLIILSFPFYSKVHPFRFMVADTWIKMSVIGFLLKLWGGCPAYYGKGLDKSLKEPREILRKGGTFLIFPRGRRTKRFYIKKGKIGTAVLALSTNTPIVPIKIQDPYPGNLIKFFLLKRKVKILMGKPVDLRKELDKDHGFTKRDFWRATEILIKNIRKLR